MTDPVGSIKSNSVLVTPAVAAPGDTVTVTWANSRTVDAQAQIVLLKAYDLTPRSNLLPTSAPVLTSGMANGQQALTCPQLPGGGYSFALISRNMDILAVSNPFYIVADTNYALYGAVDALGGSVGPHATGLVPGGRVEYEWDLRYNPSVGSPLTTHLLALRPRGGPTLLAWTAVTALSGTGYFDIPDGAGNGFYDLALFYGPRDGTLNAPTGPLIAVSSPVAVGISFAPPAAVIATSHHAMTATATRQPYAVDYHTARQHAADFVRLWRLTPPVGPVSSASTGGYETGTVMFAIDSRFGDTGTDVVLEPHFVTGLDGFTVAAIGVPLRLHIAS